MESHVRLHPIHRTRRSHVYWLSTDLLTFTFVETVHYTRPGVVAGWKSDRKKESRIKKKTTSEKKKKVWAVSKYFQLLLFRWSRGGGARADSEAAQDGSCFDMMRLKGDEAEIASLWPPIPLFGKGGALGRSPNHPRWVGGARCLFVFFLGAFFGKASRIDCYSLTCSCFYSQTYSASPQVNFFNVPLLSIRFLDYQL